MPMSFDSVLGMHETALNLQGRRAELLSSNLANADTPGYKAKDIDFREAMRSAQQGQQGFRSMHVTHSKHMQPEGQVMGADIMYRQPLQPSLDGNTVETQVEMAEFSDNSMRYLVSLRVVGGRLNKLITAFKGQ